MTMIGQQVAAKATRDALFLGNFDIVQLPRMMVAAAAISVIVVFASARILRTLSPARVVPVAYSVSALLLLGEWMLAIRSPAIGAVVFYFHTVVFGAILASGFWSMLNERFDPLTAKSVVARVASGGTIGAVIGGLAVERLAGKIELVSMFPLLAGAHLLCSLLATGFAPEQPESIGEPKRAIDAPSPSGDSGLVILSANPYLRNIALLVGLSTFSAATLDYLFKAAAQAHFQGGDDLLRFFAIFYAAMGLAGFLIQATLSRAALEKLGLARTISLVPGFAATFALLALIFPALWSVVLVRSSDGVLRSSLYRAAYELLYTPVAPDHKRATKPIIDVACDSLGDAAGAATVTIVLSLAPMMSRSILTAQVVVLGVAGFFLARRLQKGYVDALASSLTARGGAKTRAGAMIDPHTLTVSRSGDAALDASLFDRERRDFSPQNGDLLATGVGLGTGMMRGIRDRSAEAPELDPETKRWMDLRSADHARARRALAAGPLTAPLISPAIALLVDDQLYPEVLAALGKVADLVPGHVADAMLDPKADVTLRRRLARVLGESASATATFALVRALDDPDFDVRRRAAQSLARQSRAHLELMPDSDRVYALVIRELTASASADPQQTLEQAFALLALVLPAEPLRVAYRGVASDDPHHRGTALEYLSTVLPPAVRELLDPVIERLR